RTQQLVMATIESVPSQLLNHFLRCGYEAGACDPRVVQRALAAEDWLEGIGEKPQLCRVILKNIGEDALPLVRPLADEKATSSLRKGNVCRQFPKFAPAVPRRIAPPDDHWPVEKNPSQIKIMQRIISQQ